MASTWLYVAAAVVAFIIYGFRPLWQWRVRGLPGPFPTWMMGSMLQLRAKGSHIYHQELAKKYGPIFKTWGVGRPFIVVTSPKLCRDVLLHNHNRPAFVAVDTSNKRAAEFEKASILAARGDKWKSLRSAWSPMFFTGSLEAFAGLMNHSASVLAQRLGRAAEGGQTIDIWRWLGDMTMDVVGTAAFGLDLHTQTPEQQLEGKDAQRAQQLREDVAAIFRGFGGIASKYFLLLVLFPEAAWIIRKLSAAFPDSKQIPLRQARMRMIDVTTDLVAQHRAALKRQAAASDQLPNGQHEASPQLPNGNHGKLPDPSSASDKGSKRMGANLTATPGSAVDLRKGVQPGSFIDLLVRGVDRTTDQGFTDVELANQAFVMILAGYETTANTLAFAIYNLARCPDKAAKLCEELDASSSDPDYQSLDKLVYTDAVLRESLRLFPPGAIGIREAGKDQIIGGHKVQKGQVIMASFWAMHRDESVWRDAESFVPERWLDKDPKAVEQRQHAWKAFGDGPRGCPGWRFAMEEAKIALHHIFREFTFRLAPGQDPLPLSNTITLSPKKGVQVTVHRRQR